MFTTNAMRDWLPTVLSTLMRYWLERMPAVASVSRTAAVTARCKSAARLRPFSASAEEPPKRRPRRRESADFWEEGAVLEFKRVPLGDPKPCIGLLFIHPPTPP